MLVLLLVDKHSHSTRYHGHLSTFFEAEVYKAMNRVDITVMAPQLFLMPVGFVIRWGLPSGRC